MSNTSVSRITAADVDVVATCMMSCYDFTYFTTITYCSTLPGHTHHAAFTPRLASMQAADALGDRNDAKWIKTLAEMVVETGWPESEEINIMLYELLRLPPYLLCRVLCEILRTHTLSDLLREYPTTLHPSLLSAAASKGDLELDHDVAGDALPLLPGTVVPDPGLSGIQLHSTLPDGSRNGSANVTGALLARAVAAHPSLTTLSLGRIALDPGWLRSFSACLPHGALPHLVDLTLSINRGGCADLATSLALLPALTSLNVTLNAPVTLAHPAAMSLSSFTRLAAAPASLPQLQRLTVWEGCEKYNTGARPAKFLGLRHSIDATCAHSFLSVLTTPALQRLHLELQTPRVPLPTLLSNLLRFTALEELHISAASRLADIETAVFGAATFELPVLATLTVESVCVASAATVAAAFAELATTTLTSLDVVATDLADGAVFPYKDRCTGAVIADAWQGCFCVIGRCNTLQRLQLRCLSAVEAGDQRADFDRCLASGIAQSTALTHLRLRPAQGPVPLLDGSSIGDAISKATALQRISFDGDSNLTVSPLQPVLDACMQLKRLSQIDLFCDGVSHEDVTNLLTGMPDLRFLLLREDVFPQPRVDVVEALQSDFPHVYIDVR